LFTIIGHNAMMKKWRIFWKAGWILKTWHGENDGQWWKN